LRFTESVWGGLGAMVESDMRQLHAEVVR
jgi:hypothetical protein